MASRTEKSTRSSWTAADLVASLQLLARGTTAVADLAENLHAKIGQTLRFERYDSGKTSGITGFVYQNIRYLADQIESATGHLQTQWPQALSKATPESRRPKKLFFQGILNGVMGDQLAEADHPFAFPMQLFPLGPSQDWRSQDNTKGVTGKVVIFIHGLCMNEQAWQPCQEKGGVSYAQTLCQDFGYFPLFLRYNSGLHISTNGQLLAQELEHLFQAWPVPLEELAIVAHSMGGLVARSACFFGTAGCHGWRSRLRHLVFLGTPHHGAPLARIGNWVDVLLGLNRFSAPFTQLTQLRSAGITDLCHGNVLPEDWQGKSRFLLNEDPRHFLPLPQDVDCFAIAASKSTNASPIPNTLQSDGLVPLSSALGHHADANRTLAIPKRNQRVLSKTSHHDLLRHPAVLDQISAWFANTAVNEALFP